MRRICRAEREYPKEYGSWCRMKQRCNNKNSKRYKDYGGRGIKVCQEWGNNFDNFYQDMGKCPVGFSIDRIDNSGNYCKENCRWADNKTQGNNSRHCRYITLNGVTKTMSQWADDYGLNYYLLRARISEYGWDIKKALTTKSGKIDVNGRSLRTICLEKKLNYDMVRSRISKYGWGIDKAINTPPLWTRL